MPQLTFPIQPDGLLVQVLIGHSANDLIALQAAGRPLPRPTLCRGLLDTGTDMTAVVPRVITSLGVPPLTRATTTTPQGQVRVDVYEISMSVVDLTTPGATSLVRSIWRVTCLPTDLADLDVLVGMDLIRQIDLFVSGPGGTFSLTF
jgi:hypothetical protein